MTLRSTILTLAVLALACDGQDPAPLGPDRNFVDQPVPVTLVLLDTIVPSGGVVRVLQTNTGTQALYYNHCGRRLERRLLGAWVLQPPELRICTAELHTLAAGATQEVLVDAPVVSESAAYRFVLAYFPVGSADGSGVARTGTLQVTSPSLPLLP